ncbi:hypothetical protein C2845_PM12G10520 [Panicum miliaceum]|uniref:Uncharacterized protein n=1 Tax=Panicum miliaceum TaxID=4540 RepID=A0A3L6QCS4_PANMI|nr:hypothetical protein C2845_PM12G10520 [Panicum miliaceum]
MRNLPNPTEVDPNNIATPTVDELSVEDRQAYEAYMKEHEEENVRRKAKEDEEARRWFLSHFSKNRKGDISKDKEVVIVSSEDDQAKVNADVSNATSPVTLEQVSRLLVDGQERMLSTVQNMIDRSLGKQPLANDSNAPNSNVASTSQQYAMPPESSAVPAPQHSMPMSYYDGQKTPEQYIANKTAGSVLQTGQTSYGGPVTTGQTGFGALVLYQQSPEPIASVPPVQADPSRTNGFAGYCVPPYTTMTYNPHLIPPQS